MTANRGTSLSRKLKATIGYWTEYFNNRYENTLIFNVFGEKVMIKDRDNAYYTIYYKWIQIDVYFMDIFDTLDLLESLLKGVHSDVEES